MNSVKDGKIKDRKKVCTIIQKQFFTSKKDYIEGKTYDVPKTNACK